MGLPAVAGVVALVLWVIGCNDDDTVVKDRGPSDGSREKGPTPDVARSDRVPLDRYGVDSSRGKKGFSEFASPSHGGQGCEIVDLDIKSNRIIGICGPSSNRMFTIDIDTANPTLVKSMSIGDQVPTSINTSGGMVKVTPKKIRPLSDGTYAVPFALGNTLGSMFEGGVSFIMPGKSVVFSPIDNLNAKSGSSTVSVELRNITDVMAYGSNLLIAGHDKKSNKGVVVPIGYNAGQLDFSKVGTPIVTLGNKPATITSIDSTTATVLNTTDATNSWGNLVFVDLSTSTVKTRIPLRGEAIASARPANGRYEAVALENKTVDIIALEKNPPALVGNVSIGEELRDIAILGASIFVTTSQKGVVVINAKNLTKPSITHGFYPGDDLGSIVAYPSSAAATGGVIYVVATTRWWEKGITPSVRHSHIVAIDTQKATPDWIYRHR